MEQQQKEREHARSKYDAMSDQVGTSQRFKHLSTKRKVDEEIPSAPDATSLPSSPANVTLHPSSSANQTPQADNLDIAASRSGKKKKHKQYKNPLSRTEQIDEQPDLKSSADNLSHPESSGPGRKPERHSKREFKKSKSHKPPKSGSSVFQELLNKPRGDEKQNG